MYPRRSRDELEGRFVGLMAHPDPKGERDNRMPVNRRSSQVSGLTRRGDPRDKAKARLPKPQSPEDARHRPPKKTPETGAGSATTSLSCRCNLRSAERCPVRAIKEMNGAPTSRSDVQQGRTRDQPSGREPQGDGVPIVVAGATPRQGGRESRPQGEGAQATGHLKAARYA